MNPIDISDALLQFKQHLNKNPRTILSAKFGDGKSYFLKEFISKNDCHKKDGEMYFVTLHPINYSVAPNEDVFEYVKRDILVQLNKDDKLPDIDLGSFFKTFGNWDDIKSLITFALDFMPQGDLCKQLLKYAEKSFCRYKSKCKTFSKYDSVFKNQKGGLYENDAYTELIKTTLTAIKTPEKTTKVCLIIEDLDRIDPAHLFRILNVIGAHIDTEDGDENKFGFDKIVLVMDYDVTGNIFHHFYGEKANYEGYMAKFYSGSPFKYSIQEMAFENLRDILKSYHVPDKLLHVEYATQEVGAPSPSLNNRILELSVRDIERIIEKTESLIIQKSIVDKKGKTINAVTPLSIYLSVLILTGAKWHNMQLLNNLKRTDDDFTMSLGSFLHSHIDCDKIYCNPSNLSRSIKISFLENTSIVDAIAIVEIPGHDPNATNMEINWKYAYFDTLKNINGQVINNVAIV